MNTQTATYSLRLVDDNLNTIGHQDCPEALSYWDAEEIGFQHLKDHPEIDDFMVIEAPATPTTH